MKPSKQVLGAMEIMLATSIALPVVAQEKKTEAKKAEEKKAEEKKTEGAKAEPAKAKAEKIAGDIALLDTEKNYMIVVTKDGKLVTLDLNAKTKTSQLVDTKAKMSDVGLGSSAQVEYITKGEKNFLTKMIFVPAKGE